MDLYYVRNQLNMGIPITNINLRVTYYSRVSTDHLEQQKSLKNQQEYFEQFIKQNSNWTYIDGYIDDGISGTSDIKRENFMQMIEDAKRHKFDLIVTKEISRFSRNTLDSIKYTRELLNDGVAVLFVNDNINTALPDSELRLTIMASMAQDEIRRLSERVKFGMKRAIRRGEILGNDLLYGYKKDKDTGNLKIIERQAKIIREIYRMYIVDKRSLSQIVKILNNQNIRTSTQNNWSVTTLSRMISNPKYKGYYCANRTEIVDYMTKKVKNIEKDKWIIYKDTKKIPPIISEKIWELANQRLLIRKQAFRKRKSEKTIYHLRYNYSAKIYCCYNNCVFNRRKLNHNEVVWICSEYLKNGKKSCDSPIIKEKNLNFIFNDLLLQMHINTKEVFDILFANYNKFKKSLCKVKSLKDQKRKLLLKKDVEYHPKISQTQTSLSYSNKYEIESNLKDIIFTKLNQEKVRDYIIQNLLEKIVVAKQNHDKKNIQLTIYLSFSKNSSRNQLTLFLQKNYLFNQRNGNVHFSVKYYFYS